jgi:DNA transformation protein
VKPTDPFGEQVRELFAELGAVQLKRMFGGLGVYADGLMFGLGADEMLYLKADAITEPAFREAGSAPFSYARKDREAVVFTYWRLPDTAWDDPDEAVRWARLAIEAAHRAAAGKKSKRRKS